MWSGSFGGASPDSSDLDAVVVLFTLFWLDFKNRRGCVLVVICYSKTPNWICFFLLSWSRFGGGSGCLVVLLKTLVVMAVVMLIFHHQRLVSRPFHGFSSKSVAVVVVTARCSVVRISKDDSLVCCCWLCFVTD